MRSAADGAPRGIRIRCSEARSIVKRALLRLRFPRVASLRIDRPNRQLNCIRLSGQCENWHAPTSALFCRRADRKARFSEQNQVPLFALLRFPIPSECCIWGQQCEGWLLILSRVTENPAPGRFGRVGGNPKSKIGSNQAGGRNVRTFEPSNVQRFEKTALPVQWEGGWEFRIPHSSFRIHLSACPWLVCARGGPPAAC